MLQVVFNPHKTRARGCSLPGVPVTRHERRVAAIAVKLFDLLDPQHELHHRYRKLLHVAALLHDAGRVYGSKGHEHSGAAMVLADRSLAISSRQRRAIAYLIRYHRGPVPSVDVETVHKRLRVLLGMLRVADALDSRRLRPRTIIIKRKPRKLRITCRVAEALDKARRRLGGRGKFELLEAELGLRIRLRIRKCAASE